MSYTRQSQLPLLFEQHGEGKSAAHLPDCDVPEPPIDDLLPPALQADAPPPLPQLSEPEVVRHYTRLSLRNYSVDTHFYPLGSCTMKYNPKINETISALPGFAHLHPATPPADAQGALRMIYELQTFLGEITGLPAVTCQPAAGAHGEMTALMCITAYMHDHGQGHRDKVLVPDSGHGTNPASVSLCGYKVVEVKSNARGLVDVEDLKAHVDDGVVAMMLTNPNTLGLFEEDVARIAELLHDAGAMLYIDGANLNAMLGITRPGDFGADAMHINTHKTLSTPHGCGGPGAGPVAMVAKLEPYLPVPVVAKRGERFVLETDRPKSIGKVRGALGTFGVLLRAWAYIRSCGPAGLRRAAETAILSANYLKSKISDRFPCPFNDTPCMHEFVATAKPFAAHGVRGMDFAKALIDLGFHPPTMYFPLIVPEAIMIEPTETESKATMDAFAAAMIELADLAERDPDALHDAPTTTPVTRLDEVAAVRKPILRWEDDKH